ncbi:MAG: glycosyltransferase family 4 protein [Pseudomonadota bacterium]|nr:glycosyltransferase family 4 protein [Pseudomonadota bacterium]
MSLSAFRPKRLTPSPSSSLRCCLKNGVHYIMPLVDNPWTRGKCGFKLIQYMAAGLPVVASPVGANNDIVDHGHNGFLASTYSEWAEALSKLATNRDLRASFGAHGRKKIEEKYSVRSNLPSYISTIIGAAVAARDRASGVIE